ncbi:MAG: ferritin-like domain-containing protein [Thermomicrobiales bacterium]
MQSWHHAMLEEVTRERRRLATRRGFLSGSAKFLGGAAAALSITALPQLPGLQATQAQAVFADDVDVLNYALTLEHLEYAFYRDGLEQFTDEDFGVGPFLRPISAFLIDIRDHEQAHVERLTEVITSLGGTPVEEAAYNFGYTDAATFLTVAQALENTGVSAYDGAGQFLENPELLTAAGSIVAVEARHAAYLNLLLGALPFPEPFETPLTPAEVLAIAGPFIVTDPVAEATPAA